MQDASPTVGEDATVQTAFPLPPVVQIMSRIVGVWFRPDASAHGLHVQPFHGDEIVFPDERGGRLGYPIVLAIVYPTLDAPHGLEGALAAFGREFGVPAATLLVRPVLSGKLALQTLILVHLFDGRLGNVEENVIGGGEGMHATPIQADHHARIGSADGEWTIGEHECPVSPVHRHTRIFTNGLTHPHMNGDTPTSLVLTLTTILSRHTASDDDHTGTLTRPTIQGVTGLRLVTPAHEILRSLMAGTEPRNPTTIGLLPFQSGEPTRVLDTFT